MLCHVNFISSHAEGVHIPANSVIILITMEFDLKKLDSPNEICMVGNYFKLKCLTGMKKETHVISQKDEKK